MTPAHIISLRQRKDHVSSLSARVSTKCSSRDTESDPSISTDPPTLLSRDKGASPGCRQTVYSHRYSNQEWVLATRKRQKTNQEITLLPSPLPNLFLFRKQWPRAESKRGTRPTVFIKQWRAWGKDSLTSQGLLQFFSLHNFLYSSTYLFNLDVGLGRLGLYAKSPVWAQGGHLTSSCLSKPMIICTDRPTVPAWLE